MSTHRPVLAGCLLLIAVLVVIGCGERDPAKGPQDADRAPEATAGQAERAEPGPSAPAPATAATGIVFVDGFERAAAQAKDGDILLVYVGRHDPT